ncbi:MAG: glycerophosphodiester phosphodiesterase [Bacteroidetes bacterium]|jgi:glycerophosphoryl diester phosphodiesterase|nr:glycerophosphodiester phosphodiesterase [Bacteroidota bacterium]MDA1019887.1 glycerophosphodiester phosphodiesterase [Bacteroidota bacterium]|tara:strand:- start:27867 stop:28595 length:729 start_codon:yes stop_codon:yes gene_type:complete
MKKIIFFVFLITSCSYAERNILNIGHRGAKGHVAENTLASIKKAIDLGADGIEIDVFKCLSGEIVVFHDKILDKLTSGTGLIEEKTLEELKKLRVLDTQEQIPTLLEVIESIDEGVFLNIELKGRNTAEGSLKIVNTHIKNNNSILFSSFNWDELRDLRKLDSQIKIALITEEDPILAISPALNLNAVAINPSYKSLNKKNITEIHKSGLKIYTWTVNTEAQIKRMKELGVDGIITDFPEKI